MRRLLLLSSDKAWIDAAHSELRAIAPASAIDLVARPDEAVRRLVPSGHGYSHLLLDLDSAGAALPTLVGLTTGEEGSGVGLAVLGAAELALAAPVDTQFVARPSAGWLARAVAGPSRDGHPEPVATLSELREALASDRIHARYQPVVRVADRVPVGIEALARFDHRLHGTMRPDLFVPQIEAAGLAWALTETMLERAFADWHGAALRQYGLFLAVNFPLDVLLIPQALASLDRRRTASRIAADQIVVELTESRPVEHLPQLRAAVSWLRERGYGVAIDDVGPAIRDHRPLLDLAFTTLKLDKDVVRDTPQTKEAQDFLAATVATARRAGMTVLAEGVETPEIWKRMEVAGVDQAQGYLVARPLPAAAVAPWHEVWCARFTR
jgi:EAL domain-containing protein (putative c-di-GMP-specific phosphodiesterase class I)